MNAFEKISPAIPVAQMIVRGQVIGDDLIEVGGRGGDLKFLTPDASKYLDILPLGNPGKLADLYKLSFDDILDYLEELGKRLDLKKNVHMQRACELSYFTTPQTPPLVDYAYSRIPLAFTRDRLVEIAQNAIGVEYLEGWVPRQLVSGSVVNIRCFGARCLHIVAGNGPGISATTIIRNALLRSDAIIKAPSNDPFTALAIAQTMCDMAPDHPITRHLSVAYWRGGDVAFEEKLYQPHNVEKIIAWGGFAAMKHVTRYIQPGLELISLDPKRSASIVGKEAFESETTMREAALRIATDMGALNQVGCVNARVIYVLSGSDDEGIANINRLGQYVYESLLKLPDAVSTKPKKYDRLLKEHVDSLRLDGDWYKVIGGGDDEGAVIVSQIPSEVDFSTSLADRTANLVPVDSLQEVLGVVNAYTQTVGVYPEALKSELRDIIPLYGAQKLVSLGYAAAGTGANAGPQDAIEPMRRMGKWIMDEIATPEVVPPLWSIK